MFVEEPTNERSVYKLRQYTLSMFLNNRTKVSISSPVFITKLDPLTLHLYEVQASLRESVAVHALQHAITSLRSYADSFTRFNGSVRGTVARSRSLVLQLQAGPGSHACLLCHTTFASDGSNVAIVLFF